MGWCFVYYWVMMMLPGKYLCGCWLTLLTLHLLQQVQSSLRDELNFPARSWLDLSFTSSSSSSLVYTVYSSVGGGARPDWTGLDRSVLSLLSSVLSVISENISLNRQKYFNFGSKIFECWSSACRHGQPCKVGPGRGRWHHHCLVRPGQSAVSQLQQHWQHGGLRHVAQGQGHLRPAQVPSGVQCLGISARGEGGSIIRYNLQEIRLTESVHNCKH